MEIYGKLSSWTSTSKIKIIKKLVMGWLTVVFDLAWNDPRYVKAEIKKFPLKISGCQILLTK
jgi:hypothetical protein